jgi:hypothetical protein
MTAEQLRPADRDEPSGDLAVAAADVVSMRGLVITAGLCWSVLFVVLGLLYRLQFYADGSIFSYAVAVEDAWAFHWHNISGRLFVYLFCHVPAEIYVDLTTHPRGGIDLYGSLFFGAQMLGLIATFTPTTGTTCGPRC